MAPGFRDHGSHSLSNGAEGSDDDRVFADDSISVLTTKLDAIEKGVAAVSGEVRNLRRVFGVRRFCRLHAVVPVRRAIRLSMRRLSGSVRR